MSSLNISEARMHEGEMRVDVSLQVEGEKHSGPTVDIKNLSSPKSIERAVEYEFERHINMLSSGDHPKPETRRYDEQANKTNTIRLKDEEPDYRYF